MLTKEQKRLIEIGVKENLIRLLNKQIEYVEQGKFYDFSHPEEPVRAATYIELIKKGYSPKRIEFEVYPPRRVPKIPADIVVYTDNEKTRSFIVVETKASSSRNHVSRAMREGLGNANLLVADWLLLVCGALKKAYYVKDRTSLKRLETYEQKDIPESYKPIMKLLFGNEIGKRLEPFRDTKEFSKYMANSHDILRNLENKTLDRAFEIVTRILYTKTWDELNTPRSDYYSFQAGIGEDIPEVAERIRQLYSVAREREPGIFPPALDVNEDRTLFELASLLGPKNIIGTDLEVKGEAYQQFLDVRLRGEWGQFFTHRNLVRAMVDLTRPTEYIKFLDPACGSGGFLVYVFYHIRNDILKKFSDSGLISRKLFEFSHYNIYGIEIDPRIAQSAISNMILHEDAHAHIYVKNALDSWDNLDPLKPEQFHLILTNPPLGIEESRRRILSNFVLGSGKETQKVHILFLERCLEFLKPGGILCTIILDDALERMPEILDFINERAVTRAIISLPREAFIPYGSVAKTSIYLLQKRAKDLPSGEYIFMAEAKAIGYNKTGKAVRENHLPEIVKHYLDFQNQLTEHPIQENIISEDPLTFIIHREKVAGRTDVKFAYLSFLQEKMQKLKEYWKSKEYKIKKLGELASPSKKTIRVAPEEEYEFVSIHFEGTMTMRGKTKTEYPSLYVLEEGDLVASGIDLINGAVALTPNEFDGCCASKEFIVLKVGDEANPVYLWYILRSDYFKAFVNGLMTGVTGRHRIKWDQIKNIEIPIPTAEELKAVEQRYDDSIKLYQKSIEELARGEKKTDEILKF